MLTAKGDDFDRVLGLEMGADDYLPSPSMLASSWPASRRASASDGGRGIYADRARFIVFEAGDAIDAQRRTHCADGVVVLPQQREYDTLVAFLTGPAVLSARDLALDAQGRSR
jgi:DNA-binding response OmpR family regulator